jgi:hypothetical protein
MITRLIVVAASCVFLMMPKAVSPQDAPDVEGGWVLRVVTQGGLDGRGKPTVVITSQGRLTCDMPDAACARDLEAAAFAPLAEIIRMAMPSLWSGSDRTVCNDCYLMRVVLTRRESAGAQRTYAAWWDVTTQGKVPADAKRIYELAMALLP